MPSRLLLTRSNRSRASSALLPLLLGTSLLALGCNRAQDGYSGPRGTVSGTVTTEKGPLEAECQILFVGVEKGYLASGVIGEEGTYTLTYAGGPGLPTGEYQVQFSAPVPAAIPTSSDTGPVDPQDMADRMKKPLIVNGKPAASAEADMYFPSRYASTGSSGLKVKVEEGENVHDFELKP